MIVVRTVAELRAAVTVLRQSGRSVGLVPTMGALHAGHRRLITTAAERGDAVVLSIFVNPAQFDEPADLAAYPRSERADLDLAEAAGVSVAFVPTVEAVYPLGFTATVALRGPLVETLEGADRGIGHFAGVTTVVAKLLNMAQPDRAYFGQKDAQQVQVVRAMVSDLDFPVEILAVPTVREADGLALSSRNVRLTPADRRRAVGLSRALESARRMHAAGEHRVRNLLSAAGSALADAGIVPQYLALVDAASFLRVQRVELPALMLVAARFGQVRLIDNVPLPAAPAGEAVSADGASMSNQSAAAIAAAVSRSN